jgi:hypothetical protein
MSNLRINRYSELYYESDDEEYETRILLEKKKLKDNEREKQFNIEYTKKYKKTAVYSTTKIGFNHHNYISEFKEDDYNIAKYLNLDEYLEMCGWTNKIYGLFTKDEYLDMVKHMELYKNKNCLISPIICFEYIRNIQEKISYCVINKCSISSKIIYEIYLILLLDTPCVRRAFSEDPHGEYLMDDVFKECLENKLTNLYKTYYEVESEYYNKYFELGKRYFAKRNNFKTLFRNYIKFVGKLIILYNKK